MDLFITLDMDYKIPTHKIKWTETIKSNIMP